MEVVVSLKEMEVVVVCMLKIYWADAVSLKEMDVVAALVKEIGGVVAAVLEKVMHFAVAM